MKSLNIKKLITAGLCALSLCAALPLAAGAQGGCGTFGGRASVTIARGDGQETHGGPRHRFGGDGQETHGGPRHRGGGDGQETHGGPR